MQHCDNTVGSYYGDNDNNKQLSPDKLELLTPLQQQFLPTAKQTAAPSQSPIAQRPMLTIDTSITAIPLAPGQSPASANIMLHSAHFSAAGGLQSPQSPSGRLNALRRRNNYRIGDFGPLFRPTQQLLPLWSEDRSKKLSVRVKAKLEKGFFLVGGKEWTCYRRNYFQAAGAFSLNTESSALENQRRDSLTERSLMDASNTGNSWVELEPGHFHPIIGYRLGINAQVADDGGTHVELVQHTTKRDKGPQCIPIPQPILPGGSLDNSWLQLMMAEELARNGKQHQQQQQDDHQPLSEILMTGEDLNGSDNNHYCKPARVQDIVSFDRLQFRSATANNGKRRTSQQYFALSFNLFADIRNEDGSIGSHLIARSLSVPLVVRGRSPSHYNDSPYSSMSSGQSTTHQPNLPAFRNCQPPQPPLESFSAAAANQQMLGGGPLSADCLMMSSSSNNYHRFSPMTQSAMAMPLSPYSARPYRSPLEPLISSSQLPTLNSPSSSSDSSALNDNSNNGGNNLLQPFTSIMSKLDITLADGPNNKSSVSTLMMKVTLTPEQVSPPTAGLYNDEQLWF